MAVFAVLIALYDARNGEIEKLLEALAHGVRHVAQTFALCSSSAAQNSAREDLCFGNWVI